MSYLWVFEIYQCLFRNIRKVSELPFNISSWQPHTPTYYRAAMVVMEGYAKIYQGKHMLLRRSISQKNVVIVLNYPWWYDTTRFMKCGYCHLQPVQVPLHSLKPPDSGLEIKVADYLWRCLCICTWLFIFFCMRTIMYLQRYISIDPSGKGLRVCPDRTAKGNQTGNLIWHFGKLNQHPFLSLRTWSGRPYNELSKTVYSMESRSSKCPHNSTVGLHPR